MSRTRFFFHFVQAAVLVGLGSAGAAAQPAADFARCEARFLERPHEEATARCFFEVAARTGRREEAAQRLEQRLDRKPDLMWPRYYLGRLSGDTPRGLELLREAREGFAARGNAAGSFTAQVRLILNLDRQERLEEAEAELDRARAMLPAKDRFAPVWLKLVDAALLYTRGDLGGARGKLLEVESQVVPGAPAELRAEYLHRLGLVFYELGRLPEAVACFERVAKMNREQGDQYHEAAMLYMIASLEAAQASGEEDRDRIAELYGRALEAAEASGFKSVRAQAHIELGKLVRDRDSARRHLSSCVDLEEELEPLTRMSCLGALAYELADDEPGRARELMDRAIAIALAAENPWPGVYLWSHRMPVSWATVPRPQALEECLGTLSFIEALRESQLDDASRAEVFSVWAGAYSWLAGRLLESAGRPPRREDLERAFEVTERYRARVLIEKMYAARALPPPPQGRQAELRRRRLELQRRLLTGLPSAERAELRRIAREESQLRPRAEGLPSAFEVLYPPAFATLDALEHTLADDEALLSFQLASWKDLYGRFAGGSWLFAVTRDGTRVYRLAERAAIEQMILVYLGLFQHRDGSEAVPAARLYEELLRRALEELPAGVDKLVIVPDGVTHLLPFGTLRPAGEAPLSARWQISVVPSATLWLRWRESAREPAPVAALVLADPTPPDSRPGDGGIVERGRTLAADMRLGRLVGAREEGEGILGLIGGASELRTDHEASERYLKQVELERFGVVHIAAHAVVDEENAERSAVLLAAGSAEEDGKLEVREIVDLDLRGQLVVLSACHSASGALVEGEGVMSLARAFFQAGATTVVASLWQLRDNEAKELFGRFYHHLAEGRSVAAALQAAKKQTLEADGAAAAWAGVVVLGDGSVAPLERERAGDFGLRWLPWVVVALVIYSTTLGLRVWRRRRSR